MPDWYTLSTSICAIVFDVHIEPNVFVSKINYLDPYYAFMMK